MPLPNVVEALELISLDNSVMVGITVVVAHTEQCKQFGCRISIQFLQLSITVLNFVQIVDQRVRKCLIGEECSVGDAALISNGTFCS